MLQGRGPDCKSALSGVGRALQKHGSRTGNIFPKASGSAIAMNAQDEAVLRGIVSNPRLLLL
jgi:hypothetical protein